MVARMVTGAAGRMLRLRAGFVALAGGMGRVDRRRVLVGTAIFCAFALFLVAAGGIALLRPTPDVQSAVLAVTGTAFGAAGFLTRFARMIDRGSAPTG